MLIEHLFWGGRAYLAQSLMCVGGPKTASILTGARTVRRRGEASEPCGAYRKRIAPGCGKSRAPTNLNAPRWRSRDRKKSPCKGRAKAGPKRRNTPAKPQIAGYEPPCTPIDVITGISVTPLVGERA